MAKMTFTLVIILLTISGAFALNPVLLVPGYMGSQLEADIDKSASTYWWCMKKGENVSLWFNPLHLMPLAFNCWQENIRLGYDRFSRKSTDAAGVTVRESGFGDPSSVRFSSHFPFPFSQVFNSLINSLVNMGYQEKKDLLAAPYDWRKAPYESDRWLVKFENLVECSYRQNGGLPLIIICHSYGCPFVHYFLTEKLEPSWKDRYVRGLVGVAGAWSGHFQALYKFLSSEPHDLLSRLAPQVTSIERTFTSIIFLLPRGRVWNDDALIRTKQRNYTTNDLSEILRYGSNGSPELLDKLSDIPESWERFLAPGTETHCIAGTGIPTPSALILETDFLDPRALAAAAQLVDADGDGVLLKRSQSSCLSWRNETEAGGHKFSYTEMRMRHMQLIQDQEAISLITKLIQTMSV